MHSIVLFLLEFDSCVRSRLGQNDVAVSAAGGNSQQTRQSSTDTARCSANAAAAAAGSGE